MQHRVTRKAIPTTTMAGSVENIFRMLSIRQVAGNDGWRLGDTGSALVLCQAMPISNQECFVMTVAVSESQAGVAVIDQVNDKVRGTQTL